MKVDSLGIPTERNGQYFFARRSADQQRSLICRRRGLDGVDEVLVDPNPEDADHLIGVEVLDVTPDGSLLA